MANHTERLNDLKQLDDCLRKIYNRIADLEVHQRALEDAIAGLAQLCGALAAEWTPPLNRYSECVKEEIRKLEAAFDQMCADSECVKEEIRKLEAAFDQMCADQGVEF